MTDGKQQTLRIALTSTLVRADLGDVSSSRPLTRTTVEGGGSELAPDLIWRAALEVAEDVGSRSVEPPSDLEISAESDLSLVWDRDTLGAPRPGLTPSDERATAATRRLDLHELSAHTWAGRAPWLAAAEPHLWALVLDGSYVLGGAESYVVARATRGTYEVTDEGHAAETGLWDDESDTWSAYACEVSGVPVEALPEVVPVGAQAAVTDARSFVGLALPVRFGPPALDLDLDPD